VADFSAVVAAIFVTLVWDGVEVSPEEGGVLPIRPWELGGSHVAPWGLVPCWTDHVFWSSDILVKIANTEKDWAEKEGDLLPVHDCFVIHNVAAVANRCSGKGENWTR